MPARSVVDWDDDGVVPDSLPEGWRRHARRAHLDLLARWIGNTGGRWLKTDLQEERTRTRALIPDVSGTWFGIDVAHAVALAATELATAAVADVRALPIATASLDGVLSTSTLDHFERPEEIDVALRELRRVLKDGGRLVITFDNPQNPLIRLRNALPHRTRRATGLVPFFVGCTLSERQGRRALTAAGFEVLESEFLLHAPHIVGTRAARWSWFERRALPFFDRLASSRVGRYSGHYVAFLAIGGPAGPS